MGEERDQRRRGSLTPEEQRGRFRTAGAGLEESLRRVLAEGPDEEMAEGRPDQSDEAVEDVVGEHSDLVERELTDEELIEIWKTTTTGVRDGTLRTFVDKRLFIEDAMKRLAR